MSDTLKFPNGYDVVVCRKQDILDCIDDNIIDKELALAIVTRCEMDAAEFLKEGRWAGIPFMGSIRIPKGRLLEESPEQQALIDEAKKTLEKEKYILFRKQLYKDNAKLIKAQRYYKYITSRNAQQNKDTYKKLCKEKGEHYANIIMYSLDGLEVVLNEDNSNYDEQ